MKDFLLLLFFPKTVTILRLQSQNDELRKENQRLVDHIVTREGSSPVFNEEKQEEPMRRVEPEQDTWQQEDMEEVNRNLVEQAVHDPRTLDFLKQMADVSDEGLELYEEACRRIDQQSMAKERLDSEDTVGEIN